MVLKRQTVWLLTMLSLIIVLSVYYINMDPNQNQGAMGDNEQSDENEGDDVGLDMELGDDEEVQFIDLGDITEVTGSGSTLSNMTVEEYFDTIRLQRTDNKNRLSEEYLNVFNSTGTTAEAQVELLDKYDNLHSLSQKEEMLETLLRSKGYEDALVIADENDVKVYVKADELSRAEAVEILNLSRDQLGVEDIRVGFQSDN
ncbi:SpoIIIAH-like family protein [Evansella sp. AB-P1]|uniref:SpoIIIAH-like family protein n=1 Tax=Evansella sp. AB-P1 TaxID=3037653 RepID=UPI00241E4863|nr:SpoIIIAH-like family protein [Evansella sp. AB-P1]MDG5788695.1 SpoIIIAH-like family protein [Evansella sp. AB-P1]